MLSDHDEQHAKHRQRERAAAMRLDAHRSVEALEPVEPVRMCKRYLAEQVSSCDLLQQCVDVANPKGGMRRSVILGRLD